MIQYRKCPDKNAELRAELLRLAELRPRDGLPTLYRQLRLSGWKVNKKRVEKVSVPALKSLNEVWSIDFMSDRTEAQRTIRIFNVIDDASRESLLSKVAYSIPAEEVTEQLDSIALFRGYLTFIRCDNGPELRSRALAQWAAQNGVTLLCIELGKPHQNCFIKAFNGVMRDKCLNLHLFYFVLDAQQKIDSFRYDYNHNTPQDICEKAYTIINHGLNFYRWRISGDRQSG